MKALIDGGARITVVRRKFLPTGTVLSPTLTNAGSADPNGVIPLLGTATVRLHLYDSPKGSVHQPPLVEDPCMSFDFMIYVVEDLICDMLLGFDFLWHFGFSLQMEDEGVRVVRTRPPRPLTAQGMSGRDVFSNCTVPYVSLPCSSVIGPLTTTSCSTTEVTSTCTSRSIGTVTREPELRAPVSFSVTLCDRSAQTDQSVVCDAHDVPARIAKCDTAPPVTVTRDCAAQTNRSVDCSTQTFTTIPSDSYARSVCASAGPADLPRANGLEASSSTNDSVLTEPGLTSADWGVSQEPLLVLQPPVEYAPFDDPTTGQYTEFKPWPNADCYVEDDFVDDDIGGELDNYAIPKLPGPEDPLYVMPDIPTAEKPELKPVADLCDKYKDLFSTKLGRCNLVEHPIITDDSKPVAQRPRRIPYHWQQDVKSQIDDMLKEGIIRPSRSSWRSPCVFVKKKTGGVRICVDFRVLNEKSDLCAYPLPRPDFVQDDLLGAKVFTSLDLKSGYWQIPLTEKDIFKTAFCPGYGFPLYEFVVMPFGLQSAGATFQFLMDHILGHLPFVKVYLDDILIFSPDLATHIKHLEEVFRCLTAAGLVIGAPKCEFAMDEIHYVGHVYDKYGMRPDPDRTLCIADWPLPETVLDVRRFVGLVGYYRPFIPRFADMSRPVQGLITECKDDPENVKAYWTEEHSHSFDEMRSVLVGLPALAYPDFSRPFSLCCDASDVAIGSVLEQDGRPLAFFSQLLSPAQQRWHTYEKEGYALFRSLDKFKHYLLGQPFKVTVFSDHRPLEHLSTSKSPRVQRWLLAMQQYRFEVRYKEGVKNVNADALSRPLTSKSPKLATAVLNPYSKTGIGVRPRVPPGASSVTSSGVLLTSPVTTSVVPSTTVTARKPVQPDRCGLDVVPPDDVLPEHDPELRDLPKRDEIPPIATVLLSTKWTWEQIRAAQDADSIIAKVRERLGDDRPLARKEFVSKPFIAYRRLWPTLDVGNGVLVRLLRIDPLSPVRTVPVIPDSLRQDTLLHFHSAPVHFGQKRMLELMKPVVYWPNMHVDVEAFVHNCRGCVLGKQNRPPKAPLGTVPVGRPWHTLAIDYLDITPAMDGKRHLLVIQDYFTKWSEAFPMVTLTVDETLPHLLEVFKRFGPPVRIHSDQGPQFESELFNRVLTALGIKRSHSTVYHPQGNGLVERFNRSLLDMLRKHIGIPDWVAHLPALLWIYNTSIHSVTGFSPYKLMFARDPPTDFMPITLLATDLMYDPPTYELFSSTLRAYLTEQVDQAVTYAAGANKRLYDSDRPQGFYVAARVLLRLPKHQRPFKLSPMWEPDWFVTQIIGDHNPVKVVRLYHLPTKRSKVYSVDHLRIDPLQPDNLDEIKAQFPPLPRGQAPPSNASAPAQASSLGLDDRAQEIVFLGEGDDPFTPDRSVHGQQWHGMQAFRSAPPPLTPTPAGPAMVKVYATVDTANRPGILGHAPSDLIQDDLLSLKDSDSVREELRSEASIPLPPIDPVEVPVPTDPSVSTPLRSAPSSVPSARPVSALSPPSSTPNRSEASSSNVDSPEEQRSMRTPTDQSSSSRGTMTSALEDREFASVLLSPEHSQQPQSSDRLSQPVVVPRSPSDADHSSNSSSSTSTTPEVGSIAENNQVVSDPDPAELVRPISVELSRPRTRSQAGSLPRPRVRFDPANYVPLALRQRQEAEDARSRSTPSNGSN